MPRGPKNFIHGTVVDITTRMQRGLLMPPTPVIKELFRSVLAAAQSKYPVTICAYSCMPNHIHILIRVEDPEDVSDFMEYTPLSMNFRMEMNSKRGM